MIRDLASAGRPLGLRVALAANPRHPPLHRAQSRGEARLLLPPSIADRLRAQPGVQPSFDTASPLLGARPLLRWQFGRLDAQVPADLYRPSPRRYTGQRTPVYPPGFTVRRVTAGGHVSMAGDKPRIGGALRGYHLGLKATAPRCWQVWFHELDLGTTAAAACPQQ